MTDNSYEKLEQFTSVITADASSESRRIYDAIKQQSDALLSSAENEVLNDTYRFVKSEVARLRAESGRSISRAMMENKRAVALRRSEMAEMIFGDIKKRLNEFTETPEYLESMRKLVSSALEMLSGDALIYLRKADMPLAKRLMPAVSLYDAEFHEGQFELGGICAVCVKNHRKIDASYDTKLKNLEAYFIEMVGLSMAAGEEQ